MVGNFLLLQQRSYAFVYKIEEPTFNGSLSNVNYIKKTMKRIEHSDMLLAAVSLNTMEEVNIDINQFTHYLVEDILGVYRELRDTKKNFNLPKESTYGIAFAKKLEKIKIFDRGYEIAEFNPNWILDTIKECLLFLRQAGVSINLNCTSESLVKKTMHDYMKLITSMKKEDSFPVSLCLNKKYESAFSKIMAMHEYCLHFFRKKEKQEPFQYSFNHILEQEFFHGILDEKEVDKLYKKIQLELGGW